MKSEENMKFYGFYMQPNEMKEFDKLIVGEFEDRSSAIRGLMRKFMKERRGEKTQ